MENGQEDRTPFKIDGDYSVFEDSVSKSRRSSILKPPKARAPLVDVNFSNKKDDDFEVNRKRRVSFAGVNKVREFNSKVGTIHVSNTASYDELFSSSSDSSGMLLSETCGFRSQEEDDKTEKEAKILMNIISGDDTLLQNESMDITNCSYSENDAKPQDSGLEDDESKDNIEEDIRNISSFNPKTFGCLKENQKEYCQEPQDESHNSNPCEGLDLTQPILSDKMQESLADMSLESNLMTEMQSSIDAAPNYNQFPLNLNHPSKSSNEVIEKVNEAEVENSLKGDPRQIVLGQLRKIDSAENLVNITSNNQQFIESSFKSDKKICEPLRINHSDEDSDLNNSINLEFTETVKRFEDLQNNLKEKQNMTIDGERRLKRKSIINAFSDNLDDSNMEITEACVLNEHTNIDLLSKIPINSSKKEFSIASDLKTANISKEEDSLVVQDDDCSFSMELTEAHIVMPAETNFFFKNSSKTEGTLQKESVEAGSESRNIPKNSSEINLQAHDCSEMEFTKTYEKKPADFMRVIDNFKGIPENECSPNVEFTKANIAEVSEKKGNCPVILDETASTTHNVKTNYSASNLEFNESGNSKPFPNSENDPVFKKELINKSMPAENKESSVVMISEGENPSAPNIQERKLSCIMEQTVCFSNPCTKSTSFFRNNEQNLNISATMDFTEVCAISPVSVRSNSVRTNNLESSSNMELTEACEVNPSSLPFTKSRKISSDMDLKVACKTIPDTTKNVLPFTKDNELVSNADLTEPYAAKLPEVTRNFLSLPKSHELTSDMDFTEAIRAVSPNVSRNVFPFRKSNELSSNMEFTEIGVPKLSGGTTSFGQFPKNRDVSFNMELLGACKTIPDPSTNALPLLKGNELSSNMDFTTACEEKLAEATRNSLSEIPKNTTDMEFTEVCRAISSEVSRNGLQFNKNNELPSNMEFTETCEPKMLSESRNSLPFTSNRDSSSNMKNKQVCRDVSSEACVLKLPDETNVLLPSTKNSEMSLDSTDSSSRKFAKASETSSFFVTKHSFPFEKKYECSSNMEFTDILPIYDKKGATSIANIDKILSDTEYKKNVINDLDNKTKNAVVVLTNIADELKDQIRNIDHSNRLEKPSECTLKKADQDKSDDISIAADPVAEKDHGSSESFCKKVNANVPSETNFFSMKAVNTSKMVNISFITNDSNKEFNLINLDQSKKASSQLKVMENSGVVRSQEDDMIINRPDSEQLLLESPTNEASEPKNQTIALKTAYSKKSENSVVELSNDENKHHCRANFSGSVYHKEQDETDNENNELLGKLTRMDLTCNSNMSDSNELFPLRKKVKMHERNNQSVVEECRFKKKAKIVMESNNENLLKERNLSNDEINGKLQYQTDISVEKTCEPRKLQSSNDFDSFFKQNSFNNISHNIEEQCDEIKGKKASADEVSKLGKIIDSDATKNLQTKNLNEQQEVQALILLDPLRALNSTEHLKPQIDSSKEAVEKISTQDYKMNRVLKESLFVNCASLQNTLTANLQLQQNNAHLLKGCEELLSPGTTVKADISIVKEGSCASSKVEHGLASKADRISQLTAGKSKNIEAEMVLEENKINENNSILSDSKVGSCDLKDVYKDNTFSNKCLQAMPTFLSNQDEKTLATREGKEKKNPTCFPFHPLSMDYRSRMEQYNLNIQNLKFMKNLGFSRISFTEWRYNLTDALSIVFTVPSGKIEKETFLNNIYYSLDKKADIINLYISEFITNRYTEEWLTSECLTVKDILQSSDIIMKERAEMKKFYKTLNYLYRFYPCQFNANRISFYIVNVKAGIKFDVDIYIEGWKKIKANDIKVVPSIGQVREHFIRMLFSSTHDDEKRLINFVRTLQDYCKLQGNI